MSGTLSGEFSEYTTDLQTIKTQLATYKQAHQDDNALYQNAVVLETAIDGLLQRLSVPDLANGIKLSEINDITDRVDHVRGRAAILLAAIPQIA